MSKNLFAIVTSKVAITITNIIIAKSFKYSENYQNVHKKHKGTNVKSGAHRFSQKQGCPQTFNL